MDSASTGAAQIIVEHKCAEGLTLMGEALRLRVLWRCPTLPQPGGCSTIGAAGLSFQVRNGGWAFPRGYDHHKMVQPYSLECPQCPPRVKRWAFGGLCWL